MTRPEPTITVGKQTYTAEQLEDWLRDLSKLVDRLCKGHGQPYTVSVRELVRRNQEGSAPDSMVGSASDPVSSSTVSNPTAGAALSEAPYDRVHEHVEGLVVHLLEARTHLLAATALSHAVGEWQDANRGRQSTLVDCHACDNPALPRAKAGYCPACYQAWLRTDNGKGRQDREAFRRVRHGWAQEQASA